MSCEENISEYKQDQNTEFYEYPIDEAANLIINYLPVDIDEASLKNLFSEHGRIVQVKIVRDRVTKKSLGFGFVKYTTKEEAQEAINSKNGLNLGIKKIKVSFARQSSEDIKHCKLYVTNLPRLYTDKEVFDLFSRFGEIIECRLIKDHSTNISKGVAFVQFNLRNEANKALGIHGIILEGSERPLHVKFAEEQQVKRDKRNGRYNMGQMTQMGGIMGGKGYRDMDLANGMMPISYGGMSVNSASSARLPLSGGFNPRDPRYLVPYPQLSTEDSLGWGISSPYSSPRTQMPSTPYAQYLNAAYGRRNPTMYLNSPQHFLGGQSQHVQPNSRQYSYGEEQCSLRISELPLGIDANRLQEIFSTYCNVLSAEIVDIKDGESGSQKQGILQVEDLQQAEVAAMGLNGAVLREGHRPIKVEVVLGGRDFSL